MAQLAKTARMKIRVGSKTLDTNDVTLRSPLDEQTMLVWYTAHARVAAADNAEEVDGGVTGSLNMHWHIKDLFGCSDDDARYASSRIRQVLKKVSAARNISPGGAGHSPIWWISDTLPDNIITVAEWVTANHKTVDPQREGYKVKPTRAEKRLSEHEAGEDRVPAPVTVIKPTGDEVTDTEIHEVEVEGPVDNLHKDWIRKQREEHDRWVEMAMSVIAEFGPLSGNEVTTLINLPEPGVEPAKVVNPTVNGVLRGLVKDGRLVSRRETLAERTVRQTDHDKKGGQPARLYAVSSEQLAIIRDTYVSSTGSIIRPAAETEELPQPGPVTVVINNVPETAEPAALSLRERVSDLANEAWAIHNELVKQESAPGELEDLRVMNGLLEEENVKLREELETLRTEVALERKRADQVRALYGS